MAIIKKINAKYLLSKNFGPENKSSERIERKYLGDYLSKREPFFPEIYQEILEDGRS